MNNNYSYPMFESWNRHEVLTMMDLYTSVEKAYEDKNGVAKNLIIKLYDEFESINPSKMEQKQLDRDFYKMSGYSLYKTWQAANNNKSKNVRMN
ncbi:UPF0223 family protein [Apilactobacillus quenuiae]|uniref:UPF0223 family protein n=1 Tax=Apilactobacillus quenuiae TaxID=2008377 RepID=UPI0012FFFB90|nr:UPF0223 family protein [Apilactobacillus quenuiae]